MPALDRSVEVTCKNCGTSVAKQHLSGHKSRCSGGILFCPNCHSSSTKSKEDLNYHIAKKHNAAGPKNNHTCKECCIEFPSFYSLRHHKQRYHTRETTSSGGEANIQNLADAGNDKSLEEELQSCKQFLG